MKSSPASAADSVEHLAGLEGDGLEGGAGEMGLVGEAGEAEDRAARVRAPVRGEQAGERRHDVHAAVVVDGLASASTSRALDDAEVVAQPLHERAGDRDRALERVARRLVAER